MDERYRVPIKYFIIMFTLLIIANILDVVTTFKVLDLGAIEGNIMARWLFGWSGLLGAIIWKIIGLGVVIVSLLWCKSKNELLALCVLTFIVGATFTAVYSNCLIFLNLALLT